MPTPQEMQCITVLCAAMEAEIGIVVHTNNAAKARVALYRARNLLQDPTLDEIHIRTAPDNTETELWLIRRANITPAFTEGVENKPLLNSEDLI